MLAGHTLLVSTVLVLNCFKHLLQLMHFIPDEISKLLTYYTPFYRQSLQSYVISKKSIFWLILYLAFQK